MGKTLGMQVIAEGVETEEQRKILLDHECHVAQGFLFSKPVTEAEITKMLQSQYPIASQQMTQNNDH